MKLAHSSLVNGARTWQANALAELTASPSPQGQRFLDSDIAIISAADAVNKYKMYIYHTSDNAWHLYYDPSAAGDSFIGLNLVQSFTTVGTLNIASSFVDFSVDLTAALTALTTDPAFAPYLNTAKYVKMQCNAFIEFPTGSCDPALNTIMKLNLVVQKSISGTQGVNFMIFDSIFTAASSGNPAGQAVGPAWSFDMEFFGSPINFAASIGNAKLIGGANMPAGVSQVQVRMNIGRLFIIT